MNDLSRLLSLIHQLHKQIHTAVIEAFEYNSSEKMAEIVRDEEGDTIFAIDTVSERLLLDFFRKEIAPDFPLVLIAEGLPGGQVILPEGISEKEAKWRVIMDPIDGTRVLMYQKRSAWILTGVAPNLGPGTNLQDIQLAVQTEIPLLKQHLSDSVWAIKGQGAQAFRFNRLTDETVPFIPRPSESHSVAQGFAMISRYFPCAREVLAEIDEEVILGALGPVQYGKAHCFEDQYISDGGRLYELMVGHDRFVADLRPLMEKILAGRGQALGICCHPYDICSELIARELGVIITDVRGNQLNMPLNVQADVGWVGYANQHIREQIEPLLQAALKKRKLI
jgi:fructose-1,6-bisphosphatase/inositol monophosphatase family enzyme